MALFSLDHRALFINEHHYISLEHRALRTRNTYTSITSLLKKDIFAFDASTGGGIAFRPESKRKAKRDVLYLDQILYSLKMEANAAYIHFCDALNVPFLPQSWVWLALWLSLKTWWSITFFKGLLLGSSLLRSRYSGRHVTLLPN